jgi:hypothetical protein
MDLQSNSENESEINDSCRFPLNSGVAILLQIQILDDSSF